MDTVEYVLTRKQWIVALQKLLSSRDDEEQNELFREALILFDHMRRQKWEDE